MLKKFKVKNFKNFEKELVLDFAKTREYEFQSNLIKNGLINKMLVWGENNSGKSNLGAAIMDITRHLTDNSSKPSMYLYFENGNAVDSAQFTYEFLLDNINVVYSYKKDAFSKLIYEELKSDGEILFKYNYETKRFINNIEDAKTVDLKKRNQDMSALKYLYTNTMYWPRKSPVKLLMDFVNNMLWFRSLRENEYMGLMNDNESLNDFIINNNYLEEFEKFLSDFGQEFKLCVLSDGGKNRIGVKYKNYVALFDKVASTGTIALWLFFYWMNKTSNISFVFLDEFDAFYHYDLAEKILKYINSKDSFQSILTSHNIHLVDNELMRPDCYMILKDGEIKSFADSTNKTIREAHNLGKMVLGGEFEK